MADKIKVIIKRPDEKRGHVAWISNTLENFQRTVEGYIETVTVASDLVIICNEEGRLLGLEPNCTICGYSFVGTIVLAGVKGDEFCSIPECMTLKWFSGLMVRDYVPLS